MVNGKEVKQFPRSAIGEQVTNGVYGLRINHNLDVLVDQYSATTR